MTGVQTCALPISAGAAGAAGNAGDSYGGGSVGSNGLAGSAGTAGSIAAEAKAYGIYAEKNAVVDLHAKTPVTRSRSALRQIMRQAQKHMQCMPITQ